MKNLIFILFPVLFSFCDSDAPDKEYAKRKIEYEMDRLKDGTAHVIKNKETISLIIYQSQIDSLIHQCGVIGRLYQTADLKKSEREKIEMQIDSVMHLLESNR